MSETRCTVAYRLLGPKTGLFSPIPESLENDIVDPYPEGALCWVIGEHALYYLAKASIQAVAPPNVIATSRGASVPGRWIRYEVAGPPNPVCGPVVDGAFEEILPVGAVYPSTDTWWTSPAKTTKLLEVIYTRNAQGFVVQAQTVVYVAGIPVQTITDIYVYSGVFVVSVTRSVV